MIEYTQNTDEDLAVYWKQLRSVVPKKDKIIQVESECIYKFLSGKHLIIGINTHLLARNYNIIYMHAGAINDIKVTLPLDWLSPLKQANFNLNDKLKIRMNYNKLNKQFYLTNINK